MSETKHDFKFMISGVEAARTRVSGESVPGLGRADFSRRVRNEKVASVFKRFLVARVGFDAIVEMCRSPEPVRFRAIDVFVERTLFGLKEECHALFRKAGSPAGDVLYAEDLFDLLVGSIFHEMMKIKENCYILEHYGPTYRSIVAMAERRIRVPVYERLFFRACKRIIERASGAVYEDIRVVEQLFDDATEHLLSILPRFANNGLVTRIFIENEHLVEMAYGEGGLKKVLLRMYEGRLANAYLHAACSYKAAGRIAEAEEWCAKSLREEPAHVGARRLMESIPKKK